MLYIYDIYIYVFTYDIYILYYIHIMYIYTHMIHMIYIWHISYIYNIFLLYTTHTHTSPPGALRGPVSNGQAA